MRVNPSNFHSSCFLQTTHHHRLIFGNPGCPAVFSMKLLNGLANNGEKTTVRKMKQLLLEGKRERIVNSGFFPLQKNVSKFISGKKNMNIYRVINEKVLE